MTSGPALSTRDATESDLRFVRASWFESFRSGGYAPQVAFPTYRAGQGGIIEGCLKRGQVLVAYATAVPDEICSWINFERGLIHYVYTKQAYRKMGIAKKLIECAGNGYANFAEHTHHTRVGQSLAAKIGTKLNPYPLYPPPPTRSK